MAEFYKRMQVSTSTKSSQWYQAQYKDGVPQRIQKVEFCKRMQVSTPTESSRWYQAQDKDGVPRIQMMESCKRSRHQQNQVQKSALKVEHRISITILHSSISFYRVLNEELGICQMHDIVYIYAIRLHLFSQSVL